MMQALWISKTGMDAQQTQLNHISHNLANASTNGYKQSHAVFEDLMYQNLRQAGANQTEQTELPVGLQVGLGVRTVATVRNFTQGNLNHTTNPLDLAIKGDGFFQIQMPDGTEAYTRDGSFQVNADGELVTNNGFPVQPGIVIPADITSLTIGSDGTVSATVAGEAEPMQLGQITLARFINPAGLDPKGGNLFTETAASGTPIIAAGGQDGMGMLAQNYVEVSNVNVVEELVQMIQTQRVYELNSKSIQTADQMLQRLSQL